MCAFPVFPTRPSYFLSQLTTAVYLPIFFGIVLWEFKFTNWITPTMTSFPKTKFLIMGMFDALSGIFMLFGSVAKSERGGRGRRCAGEREITADPHPLTPSSCFLLFCVCSVASTRPVRSKPYC